MSKNLNPQRIENENCKKGLNSISLSAKWAQIQNTNTPKIAKKGLTLFLLLPEWAKIQNTKKTENFIKFQKMDSRCYSYRNELHWQKTGNNLIDLFHFLSHLKETKSKLSKDKNLQKWTQVVITLTQMSQIAKQQEIAKNRPSSFFILPWLQKYKLPKLCSFCHK